MLTNGAGPLCSGADRLTCWDLKSTLECSTPIASHSLDFLAVGHSTLKGLSLFCFNCLRRVGHKIVLFLIALLLDIFVAYLLSPRR